MNLSLVSNALSQSTCQTLAQDDASTIINSLGDNLAVAIVFGVGGVVGIIAIFFGSITSAQNRKEREKTKRELAAYVAEGSMTPADAERIMKADTPEEE
ncbi:MAG: hypothetical protein ACSHX5_07595 [Phycisphaerales bacterium]